MSDRFLNFNLRGSASSPPHAALDTGAVAGAAVPVGGDWSQRLHASAGDDAALLALAREAVPLEIKLAAIAALSGEAALNAAEREFRDHDRRVHRLAKQRHGHAVAQREARSRAALLIDQARVLAGEALIPLNRVVDIDRGWSTLAADLLEPAQRADYAALMQEIAALTLTRADRPLLVRRWTEQARAALTGLQQAQADAARGAQNREQLAAALAAAQGVVDATPQEAAGSGVLEELARSLALGPALDERLAALDADPSDRAQRWAQLAALPDPSLDQLLQTRFAQLQRAQEQMREQERAEQRERNQQRQRTLIEQGRLALCAQLDLAEAALADGQLAAAAEALAQIDKLLAAGAPAGALRTRIDALHAQVTQLKGWQHWGGGQARDELVQEAEALAAATIDATAGARAAGLAPRQQVEHIDALRARWKEIDHLGGATNRALWQRFDAALKTAYEPVGRQVAAQRAAREQNLLAREGLLAAIEAVPTSDSDAGAQGPDWRALVGALDHFHAAWRKLGPIEHTVPNAAREPLLLRMASVLERLEGPLQEARHAARLQRERLLADARALAAEAAAGTQGRDLVGRVRGLQAQWQQQARALPLARADENRLWLDFKAAIDGAFSARNAAFLARDAVMRTHAAERVALVERLEGLGADTPAPQLKRVLAEVEALWQRAGPAPRDEAAALDGRFARARDAAHRWLAGSGERAWYATCDALAAKLALCELLDDPSTGSADPAAVRAEFELRWSALPPLPEPLEHALAARAGLATAAPPTGDLGLAASTDELLLQIESAWGVESPPAFEAARRELKLKAMKAALETRRPAAAPATPGQCFTELLRRTELDTSQRERLLALLSALRRRGSVGGPGAAAASGPADKRSAPTSHRLR